jgi:hypothetical protein
MQSGQWRNQDFGTGGAVGGQISDWECQTSRKICEHFDYPTYIEVDIYIVYISSRRLGLSERVTVMRIRRADFLRKSAKIFSNITNGLLHKNDQKTTTVLLL